MLRSISTLIIRCFPLLLALCFSWRLCKQGTFEIVMIIIVLMECMHHHPFGVRENKKFCLSLFFVFLICMYLSLMYLNGSRRFPFFSCCFHSLRSIWRYLCSRRELFMPILNLWPAHTHTYTHIYIIIYLWWCSFFRFFFFIQSLMPLS